MGLIAGKIITIFIYISIGFFCNRIKMLPIEANKYLIALMLNITTPGLMISSITTVELRDGMVFSTFVVLAVSIAIMWIVSLILIRVNTDILHLEDGNELAVAMTGCNNGFMGMPIALSIFGNTVFYYVMIANVCLNIYMFVICLPHLHYGESGRDEHRSLKKILMPFVNVPTITSILSIIILFSRIRIPDYPLEIMSEIGAITIPLSMIVVGIQLGDSNLVELFKSGRLLFTSLIKLVIVPLITLGIAMLLPVDDIVRMSIVVSMMFPTAVVSVAIATYERRNSQIMAEAVALTTLLSMITLPIWIAVLNNIFA